jgi:hypothetical protein
VARLRGEPDLWVIVDGSALRKPYAATMAHLQWVKRLAEVTGEAMPPYHPPLVWDTPVRRRGKWAAP